MIKEEAMPDNMIFNVPPAQIGKCNEFINQHGEYPPGGRTIVVTPLRVTIISADSNKISFGCNFWKSCQNKDCSYCQAGMVDRWEDRK